MSGPRLPAAAALGLLALPAALAASAGGVGPYRFGMTKQQVLAVRECASYRDVPGRSQLECPNFPFAGRPRDTFLIFRPEGLSSVQIWFYEGKDRGQAEAAMDDLFTYMRKEYGGKELKGPSATSTRKELLRRLDQQTPSQGFTRVQWRPKKQPDGAQVFASVFRHVRRGYYIFLQVDDPAQTRRK